MIEQTPSLLKKFKQEIEVKHLLDKVEGEIPVYVRTLLELIGNMINDENKSEEYIQEIYKHLADSNKLDILANLLRYVAIKIPSHFARFMEIYLNYYQISITLNPEKTKQDSDFVETIEEYLKECSQLQQVLTTTMRIHDCPVAHPMCTKQILKMFGYGMKHVVDSNEMKEERFHAEEESLLEKLKNFKSIYLTEIVISIVRLYPNDPSLKAFILYQVLKKAANKRFKLDPTWKFLICLHILRSMNEMVDSNDLQTLPLPFCHFFECEKNVLVLSDYYNILNVVYCSLKSSFSGMENVVWTCIAKSTIPTLLKIENLIPNVGKSSYYANLSRLAEEIGDLIMKEVYLQKAEQYMEEHDKVYPYATD